MACHSKLIKYKKKKTKSCITTSLYSGTLLNKQFRWVGTTSRGKPVEGFNRFEQ